MWYNVTEKARGEEMTAEELEKIVARHEMQCLELKESLLGIDPAKFGVLDRENVATSLETGPKTGPKGRYKIIELLRERPKITIADLVEETRLSRNGVKWNIGKLKEEGLVRRVGPAKGGDWEVVEP